MSSSNFKHDLFNQFARVAKALSNGYRLELLEYLAQGERSVDALAKVSGLTIANTSQHLQQLRQAGLVTTRKAGVSVFYRLSDDDVVVLLNTLRSVAERHVADVDRLVSAFLTVKDDLEPVPAEELLARAREGLVRTRRPSPRRIRCRAPAGRGEYPIGGSGENPKGPVPGTRDRGLLSRTLLCACL